MWFLFKYFIIRLPRDNFRSLSVTALAFALVFLINVMGGVRERQQEEYERVRRDYEVAIEMLDGEGAAAEDLFIDDMYFALFTDPDALFSLAGYVKDVLVIRELDIVGGPFGPEGSLIGVSAFAADNGLGPDAVVAFLDGYNESAFMTGENVCVVSENAYGALDGGILKITVRALYPRWREEVETVEAELAIVGVVRSGIDAVVYCPFITANELGRMSDGSPFYSDKLSAVVSDNDRLDELREAAKRRFAPVGTTKFQIVIYDSLYFELLARIKQNISFVEVVTPVLYLLSVCMGVAVSYLLTRRRTHEFAVMRSTGVSRADIFFTAVSEQAALCLFGAAIGFVLFALTWGGAFWTRTLAFCICYVLGTLVSAARAAGTNVLEILGKKE